MKYGWLFDGMVFEMAKLTTQQAQYCQHRVSGNHNKVESYMLAYPKCQKNSASNLSNKLEKKPQIIAEIKRLQGQVEDKSVLTRMEKRQFLARVVRAKLADMDPEDPNDPDADLIHEITKKYDKDGCHLGTTAKLPGKLQAVEIDNRMSGHNEPEKVEHTINGGVMLVPIGGTTLDEWEKEAMEQQEDLKEQK